MLQCGSVEGRIFHRGAVQALNPEDAQLAARLTGLVRKELIRPDKAQLPGEDAFRFRHLLIRDAAYDALPKAARAELHERFADWLEEHGADLVELDEMLGYHLEQAIAIRQELGEPGEDRSPTGPPPGWALRAGVRSIAATWTARAISSSEQQRCSRKATGRGSSSRSSSGRRCWKAGD